MRRRETSDVAYLCCAKRTPVCGGEKKREKERKREKKREKERKREKKREKERKRVKEQTDRENLFVRVFFVRESCSLSRPSLSLYSLSL